MSPVVPDATPVGPRVGVLLPVHAGADPEHFREALISMRAQEGVDARIFLGCDGVLLPAHEQVVDELLDESDVVVRSDRRSGVSLTLNRTIEAALGDSTIEFLARMDADDISVPRRFLQQVQFLREHPDTAVVGSWCIEFARPGVATFHKRLPCAAADVRRTMVHRSPLAHPSVMFHRRVFEGGFRYDPSCDGAEDYELWSRLLQAGIGISNVPEYLLWFRTTPGLFARRSGWRRGATEVRLRVHYARAAGLLRPWDYLGFAALMLVRVAPAPLRRIAYRMRG
ncbi:MAG: wcfQ [Panacagrimonas sp.]|jgi:hypothetical protein|nr:glycosyltransferase [Panacagrimonas sp.]MCC2658292.1 wcfQ [Panacagrimonas sp.]